jgi:hypothetical protein
MENVKKNIELQSEKNEQQKMKNRRLGKFFFVVGLLQDTHRTIFSLMSLKLEGEYE